MPTVSVPVVWTSSTLDDLLNQLDAAFNPPPSAGFNARWGILTGLTALYMVLLLVYLGLHVAGTKDRPRWKSLWLMRFVERPSGRFLVLNPRPTWSIPLLYGAFELAYLAVFFRVYRDHMSQATWFTLRGINAPLLFIPGWLISWSGLQAFLVSTEANNSRFVPAWLANWTFVAGGILIFAFELAYGIVSSVLGTRFWNRYQDLRDALLAVKQSTAGRAPTLTELAPLAVPFERFSTSSDAWERPAVGQYAVTTLMPLACMLVNLGGLALARRLHLQIRDSVEVLALVEARRTSLTSTHKNGIPLEDLSSSRRRSSFALDLSRGGGEGETSGEKRKPSLTTGEVKFLARQTDEPSQAQARKVLALQKAMRDLVMVATTVATLSLAFTVNAILVAVWSGDEAIYKGRWPITEAAISLPCWIYSCAVVTSVSYLLYNALVHGRLTQPVYSDSSSSSARGVARRPSQPQGPANAFPQTTGSIVSGFVENARSGSAGGGEVVPNEEEVDVMGDSLGTSGERKAEDEEAATSRPSSPLPPPSPAPPVPSTSETSPSRSQQRSGGLATGARTALKKPSWLSLRSGGSGGAAAGGGGRQGGKGGARPNSLIAQGIVFTVESEQVCEGDSCAMWWKDEEERPVRRDEEEGYKRAEGEDE
ncbi:hypothetical protein JCM8097_004384 [Rhodosporidiobolus ruineniae]